jgi:hypothetical protein
MFQLPKELQIRIYEYDNTYHDIFQDCLQDIQYRLYITHSTFYKKFNIGNNNDNNKHAVEMFSFQKINKQHYSPLQRKEKIQNYLFNKLLIDFYMNDTTYLAFNGLYFWWNRIRKCITQISRSNNSFPGEISH